jgi:hypothetical protein
VQTRPSLDAASNTGGNDNPRATTGRINIIITRP